MPDPSLSIDDGALVPWSVGGSSGFYEAVIQAIADRYEIDTSKPWAELTEERAGPLPLRHRRREDLRPVPQPHGAAAPVHARVRRHRREPRSAATRRPTRPRSASGSRSTCRCGRARSARARASSRRCSRSRSATARSTSSRRCRSTRALGFLDELELTTDRGADRAPDREGDPRAAHVPRRRRRRLPHARPRGGDAVGRRGAAAAARDADRLAARRRPLHPRRAVDRAPPARQRAADRHARAAARHRQHRRRRRARRGDDAPLRLARRHGAGRRPARRRGRRRGAGGEGRAGREVGHRASSSRASASIAVPERRDEDRGSFLVRGARSTTSRTSTSSSRSASSSA